MTDGAFRSIRALKREVSSDGGGSLFSILIGLRPYIWPSDRRDLKIRVAIAMGLLLLAKLSTIAVLLYQFDWRYVAVILVTVACYMAFTYVATEWRINIRRRMNDSDTDANIKAIDSLLNYETVKYFVAEEREAGRYDRSMERYEDASVQAYTSLAVLNAGQAVIFTIRLAAVT